MKVLLIDVNCKYSSTGKIVYDLYSYINSIKGCEASVCYGRGPTIKEKNIYKFGLDLETFFHACLSRITGYTGCFSFFSTLRLIKYIKKYKPEVVHIHELHAYFVNITKLLNFLKKLNIRVIHTLHCSFSYTGKCGHHLDCNKWKTQCDKCPRLHEYVSSLYFDKTKYMYLKKKKAFLGFNDLTIVTPSKWLECYVKESFLRTYEIVTIHNGINCDIFHPKSSFAFKIKMGIPTNKKIVLSVAPNIMSDSKGGEWILKLAEELLEENIFFVLIGANSIPIVDLKNVMIFGRISDQIEIAEFYSSADLFIICSKMENFPTTCLEAQCCGTPFIGFDVGGIKETICCENSSVVPYADLSALKKTVLSYLRKNHNEGEKNINSQRASNVFSRDKMLLKYFELYNK